MRDEEYATSQIPVYGRKAQPAVAQRMLPQLRMTQAGSAAALLAVILAAIAIAVFPNFTGTPDRASTGLPWAIVTLVCAGLLLAICLFQMVSWVRAMQVWRGESTADLTLTARISWILHAGSYLVVLVAVVSAVLGCAAARWNATASWCLVGSLLAMLAAQVLAGVQYLRSSGPPGTVPAHMRKLIERADARSRA